MLPPGRPPSRERLLVYIACSPAGRARQTPGPTAWQELSSRLWRPCASLGRVLL